MRRLVPPAGTQISPICFFRAVRGTVNQGRFEAELGSALGVRHAFAICSGRAALLLILRALHRLQPTRSIVILPAYTCFSVAAATVRAGLQVMLLDVNPESFDFDYSALDRCTNHNVLCIIAGNLFGIPSDVKRLRSWAQPGGVYVVDDAAQSLGAKREGQSSGTLGDVGMYSLGRGKGLGIGAGGVAVTDNCEIAGAIRDEVHACNKPEFGGMLLLRAAATSILLNPHLYWVPDRLPFLNLGVTEFNPQFKVACMPRTAAALAAELLGNIPKWNDRRREIAAELSTGLAGQSAFGIPQARQDCQSACMRFPLVASSGALRDAAVQSLRAAGYGASPFYPSAICDIPSIGKYMISPDFHCVQAEKLARTILTLPTHALVSRSDTSSMIKILKNMSGQIG